MKLTIENTDVGYLHIDSIRRALGGIPPDGGVAILEEGNVFIQARRHREEYEVEYIDAESSIFYKTESVQIETLVELFTSYYLKNDAWKSRVEWVKADFQLPDDTAPEAAFMEPPSYLPNVFEHAPASVLPSGDELRTPTPTTSIFAARPRNRFPKASARPQPPSVAPLSCNRCGSTQLTANQKGYGALKGLSGLVVAGPAGLLAGFFGKGKVKVTCLNCGHQWSAGSKLR